MASPILVTGGTGALGRLVVPRLRDAGYDVRVLSRHSREGGEGSKEGGEGIELVTGDLATGEGIQAAVAGTGVIVHCAGSAKGDQVKARHLVRAAARAGARHLVAISVVGADRIPVVSGIDRAMFGYSRPSLPPSAWWPTPACRGRRCAPPSSTPVRPEKSFGGHLNEQTRIRLHDLHPHHPGAPLAGADRPGLHPALARDRLRVELEARLDRDRALPRARRDDRRPGPGRARVRSLQAAVLHLAHLHAGVGGGQRVQRRAPGRDHLDNGAKACPIRRPGVRGDPPGATIGPCLRSPNPPRSRCSSG
jgi:hypothetical protein